MQNKVRSLIGARRTSHTVAEIVRIVYCDKTGTLALLGTRDIQDGMYLS